MWALSGLSAAWAVKQANKDDEVLLTETKQEKVAPKLVAIDAPSVAQARAGIPGEAVMALVVETFQALADPTRAHILYALRKGRLCVRDLAIIVGVSQSAVSHQMSFLRRRRLVRGERSGTSIYYSLDDAHVGILFREAEYHADHVLNDLPDHADD